MQIDAYSGNHPPSMNRIWWAGYWKINGGNLYIYYRAMCSPDKCQVS
jgi:hypothetical protein